MPNPTILRSIHGRKLGLSADNDLIVSQDEAGGLADAQADVWSIAKGQLTSAQLLAMNATPIEVIAAPGAGYFIEVAKAHFFLDYATAYTAGAGEDLVLRYTNGSGEICTLPVDGTFLALTADAFAIAPGGAGDDQALIAAENAAVVAHIQSGEVTGGTSVVNYEVWYRRRLFDMTAS